MKKIIDFLKTRPALNLTELERLCGMPKRTLLLAVKGGRNIPKKHLWVLCKILSDYSLEIEGNEFIYDADTDIFIVQVFINEVGVKIEETENKLIHYVPFERFVIEDENYLIDFLK